MKKIALVTGSTGLLGSWLICALLRSGRYSQIHTIARANSNASARARVFRLLKVIPHKINSKVFEKLTVIKGDVSAHNLGLGIGDLNSLEIGGVTDIFHVAAVADFNMSLTQIRPTNVVGTQNVFTMALALKQRRKKFPMRVHYISTIAIAGNSAGWFDENQFDIKQSFNNAYEQSKYEAEKIARKYFKSDLVVKIYRPAIITGDSKYGITTNFKMIYQPLHFLSHNLFQELPANGECLYSFVPVDKVADAISILSECNLSENSVHHLVNPYEIRLDAFIKMASRVLKFEKPLLLPLSKFRRNKLSEAQWKLIDPFVPYFNYRLRFKATATNNLLETLGFHWPKVDGILLKTLLDFCAKSKFIPLE